MGSALARLPRRVRVSPGPGSPERPALPLHRALRCACIAVTLTLAPLVAPLDATAAGPFPDAVPEFDPGPGGGFQQELLPDIVLGGPRGAGAFKGSLDVVSLGDGGRITVAFHGSLIVDGPGPDFTVFENAFLVPSGNIAGRPFAEAARVSVSTDGVDFVDFPCALDDEAGIHPGCAGVYPVFANADEPLAPPATEPTILPITALIGAALPLDLPDGSGGDSFDLADVGLPAARFVRIVSGPGLRPNGGRQAGFDLDAIAAINWHAATDQDTDGIDDALDNCPAIANEDQADADDDDVGDRCDPCPAGGDPERDCADEIADDSPGDGGPTIGGDIAPDMDGDGAPDDTDNCPATTNSVQIDGDGDGSGDACDLCPLVIDATNLDTDGDGIGDACDPCPDDGACGPALSPAFVGGKARRESERLLSFVAPSAKVTRVARGALAAEVWITFGPTVDPGTLRVKIDRADATALLGPIVPGTSKRVTLPLGGRRTRVSFRIKGAKASHRRAHDTDRLVFRRRRK